MGTAGLALTLLVLAALLLAFGIGGHRPLLTALGAILLAASAIYGVKGSIPVPHDTGHGHGEGAPH